MCFFFLAAGVFRVVVLLFSHDCVRVDLVQLCDRSGSTLLKLLYSWFMSFYGSINTSDVLLLLKSLVFVWKV